MNYNYETDKHFCLRSVNKKKDVKSFLKSQHSDSAVMGTRFRGFIHLCRGGKKSVRDPAVISKPVRFRVTQ